MLVKTTIPFVTVLLALADCHDEEASVRAAVRYSVGLQPCLLPLVHQEVARRQTVREQNHQVCSLLTVALTIQMHSRPCQFKIQARHAYTASPIS